MIRDNVELHLMLVTVAVHDGLTGALYPRIKIRLVPILSANRLCAAALSESDSADAIVPPIEALKMSSED
jgi:hypothetical protein